MLFEERVQLEPVKHQYWHRDGREFTSWSRVFDCIKPQFDPDGAIAAATAAKKGVPVEVIQAEWSGKGKKATDHGTAIHDALERYAKTAMILPQDEHLRPAIISIFSEYREYYKIHAEKTLFSEEHEVAGTTDLILETTKHRSSILDLEDYKTNISKGIQFTDPYKKYLLGPFSHIMYTNYYQYSLQLSVYAFMAEQLTDRKIGKLTIVFIPPKNPLAYRRIPVPYMRMEAKALLDYHKELKNKKPALAITDGKEVTPTFN